MALAALISACRTVAESEDLRALLPVAGHTLIEHQARLAVRGGADHVVVLVERLPADLVAAIDRLRHGGVNVEIARTLSEAIGRIPSEDRLLLIADGFVGSDRLVARVAEAQGQAILTVPDNAAHARFERIDATARWGGLLLLDGQRLRQVSEMLGDWDLESTLLRRAVQDGAARLPAEEGGAEGPPRLIEQTGDLDELDALLFAASSHERSGSDWPQRYLYPAAERIAVPPLLRRTVEPGWLTIGAAGATWCAALLALAGWRGPALFLLLLSGPLTAVAERLAATRLIDSRETGLLGRARAAGAVAALLALIWRMEPAAGWGVWPLALLLLLGMAALIGERRVLARLSDGTVPSWLASLDGLILMLLPFALAGYWLTGIAMLVIYAAVSLFAVQREVAVRLAVLPHHED
ncbi:MAG TPA: hypothetical protein VNZ43_06765 [Sphingomonadaceae bacterium]|nr:hypothetical protein [Sphingomonadaceae bacterium]